jgi:hypothetical protein
MKGHHARQDQNRRRFHQDYAHLARRPARIGRICCTFVLGGRAGISHNGLLFQHLWWGERVAGSREAGFGERFEFFPAEYCLPFVKVVGRGRSFIETGDRQTVSACAGPGSAKTIMRGSEDVELAGTGNPSHQKSGYLPLSHWLPDDYRIARADP